MLNTINAKHVLYAIATTCPVQFTDNATCGIINYCTDYETVNDINVTATITDEKTICTINSLLNFVPDIPKPHIKRDRTLLYISRVHSATARLRSGKLKSTFWHRIRSRCWVKRNSPNATIIMILILICL